MDTADGKLDKIIEQNDKLAELLKELIKLQMLMALDIVKLGASKVVEEDTHPDNYPTIEEMEATFLARATKVTKDPEQPK